jgi:hypothetical protein
MDWCMFPIKNTLEKVLDYLTTCKFFVRTNKQPLSTPTTEAGYGTDSTIPSTSTTTYS